MARKSPEINAGSMADIAFLLLIFFLVTTTMGTDSGIQRVLPPLVDKQNDDGIENKERNTLVIKVAGNDAILVGGQRVGLNGVVGITKEFITNPTLSEHLPETETVQIPLIGAYEVNKGVISLQNDVSTTYEVYLAVQNELTRAYNEVRDDVSNRFFQKKFSELNDEQKKAITTAIPNKVSEAEPVDLTGGKK